MVHILCLCHQTEQLCRAECTLAASHSASRRVTVSMPTGQTDGQTDERQTVTLRFLLDAASLIIW